MKLRVLSDLHLEFDPGWRYTPCGEDAVLCAGDLGVVSTCSDLVERLVGSVAVPFYYVIGNHDAYQGTYTAAVEFYRGLEQRFPRFRLLHNESVVLGNYRLLGTPLWTDFALRGQGTAAGVMREIELKISDFRLTRISDSDRRLVPNDLLQWHAEARLFLRDETANQAPTLVLTHWGPTGQATPRKFASSALEPYFSSNCEELFAPHVALWVHGHTHSFDDRTIQGTRLLRNPKGYPSEDSNWRAGLVIELP